MDRDGHRSAVEERGEGYLLTDQEDFCEVNLMEVA